MSTRARRRGGAPSPARSSSRSPRQQGGGAAPQPGGFWGDGSDLPAAVEEVRIADDPSAVVRSLGPPPLAGRESISEHYFATVYDRAVGLASALAAAGGLISPEALQQDRAD